MDYISRPVDCAAMARDPETETEVRIYRDPACRWYLYSVNGGSRQELPMKYGQESLAKIAMHLCLEASQAEKSRRAKLGHPRPPPAGIIGHQVYG